MESYNKNKLLFSKYKNVHDKLNNIEDNIASEILSNKKKYDILYEQFEYSMELLINIKQNLSLTTHHQN